MPPLYPKPRAVPSLTLVLALSACSEAPDPAPPAAEPWPNEHELVFQQAAALRYSLEQQKLEAQRLREAGAPVSPPAPR